MKGGERALNTLDVKPQEPGRARALKTFLRVCNQSLPREFEASADPRFGLQKDGRASRESLVVLQSDGHFTALGCKYQSISSLTNVVPLIFVTFPLCADVTLCCELPLWPGNVVFCASFL